jgi:hypothetical protein
MRLLVLGGRPAGLNVALQARELNAQVTTLVEPGQRGRTTTCPADVNSPSMSSTSTCRPGLQPARRSNPRASIAAPALM